MTGSNEVINPEMIFPECQKRHIFMLLMCAGGFMGAYTYILRGGVFCNAQTANFVLLAIALGQGHWKTPFITSCQYLHILGERYSQNSFRKD